MAKCKACGDGFHACRSCQLEDFEWDYCDKEYLKKRQRQEVPFVLGKYHLTIKQLRELLDDIFDLYLYEDYWSKER